MKDSTEQLWQSTWQLSARRKRTAFTVVTLLVPVLLLITVELLLRLASYGPNLDLFVKEESEGRTFFVMNPELKARYFSRTQFTPSTSLDFFQSPKPPGTYRIFCLGGSTTVGFPFGQAGSFSSFLREQLKARFPNRSSEVINLGMTATNSYTVNDIAHDLAAYEPDLLIVYDGHNEFYGALGSASVETISGARWVTKLYLRLIHLKTFQLLSDAIAWARGLFGSSEAGVSAGTTLMESLAREQTVPFGSDLYRQTLANFQANLQDLSGIGSDLGVPVIVCTQVSNLRDLSPFVSQGPENTISTKHSDLVTLGPGPWREHEIRKMLEILNSALSVDSLRADLHFAVARCLDSLGMKHPALDHYRRARDYDLLRFRMSGEFNDAVRQATSSGGLLLADMERAFMAESADSLVGSELILEHLHPTLKGYALMGRILASTIEKYGLMSEVNSGVDETLFSMDAVTTVDLRAAQMRIDKLVSAWPFNGSIRPSIAPLPEDGLDDIVRRYAQGALTWEQAHVEAAEYFTRTGDLPSAGAEYRALALQFPLKTSPLLRLAQVSLQLNQTAEARQALERSLAIAPGATAYTLLGLIELNARRDSAAVLLLEKAFSVSADRNELRQSGYLLGVAWYRLGNLERALAPLRASVEADPAFEPSRRLLDRVEQVLGTPR